ncbi:hypothetical protein EBZ80_01945 [bacterium]|nr:hypothetical protein [bacterium]
MEDLILVCPHCGGMILIHRTDVRCRIFRHAVYRDSHEPIDPHTPRERCEALIRENKVFGCGRPFRLNEITDEPEICDYL